MMTQVKRCRMLQTLTAASLIGLCGAVAGAQSTSAYIPSFQHIGQAVQTELETASEVSAPLIDVSINDGIVTLTGSVPTMLDKQRAAVVAETVRGVRSVVNRLEVATVDRPDEAIAADIVRALAMDPAADSYELQVSVDDGTAHISGSVESWHERELAAKIARSVRGVRDVVTHEILMEPVIDRPDMEIRADVRSRLKWDRWIDEPAISVAVDDGRVKLSGSVTSAAEKRRAMTMAWVSGVTDVDDRDLEVRPWADDPTQRDPDKVAQLKDSEIERAIADAMLYDPRVLGESVSAECEAGIVTLTGEVNNLRARRAAEQDARNTVGVSRVRNFVVVRPDAAVPNGDDLRDRVLEVIERDPIVWRDGKYINIVGGTVYLMGDARSSAESDRAVEIVSTVPGVVEVINKLETGLEWDWKPDRELVDDVESQLFWSPFVDSDDITVTSNNGVVTLTGEVDDWAELAAARENAWDADPKAVHLELEIVGS